MNHDLRRNYAKRPKVACCDLHINYARGNYVSRDFSFDYVDIKVRGIFRDQFLSYQKKIGLFEGQGVIIGYWILTFCMTNMDIIWT